MKSKKLYVALIGLAFIVSILLCCFNIFSVKSINVTYNVSAEQDTFKIQNNVNSFCGKNLLTLDTQEISKSISEFYNIKVISVTKKYPNEIDMVVEQRFPAYYVSKNGKCFVLDKEGFCIQEINGDSVDNLICLTLDDINANFCLGEKVNTSDNELFDSMLKMSESVNLTDCIVKIDLHTPNKEIKDVIFATRSGVTITVKKANEKSVEKITKAFELFDSIENDYLKTYNNIVVTLLDSGEIVADWVAK